LHMWQDVRERMAVSTVFSIGRDQKVGLVVALQSVLVVSRSRRSRCTVSVPAKEAKGVVAEGRRDMQRVSFR
jgi:hypothetical protein